MNIHRSGISQLINLVIILLSYCGLAQSDILNTNSGHFQPNPDISANGEVRAVVIYDSILYIGGSFTKVTDELGSYNRNGLAAINLTSGRVTSFRADINRGTVRSITIYKNILYAGGTFTKVNSISRSKIVAVDPVSGQVLTTFSNTDSEIDGPVFAVACLDDKLFAGGNFTHVNGVSRSYLAVFDAINGALDLSINPSPCDSIDVDGKMDGGVYALETYAADSLTPGILFVGGNFQTICGESGRQFLVALHPDGTLGPDFKKSISSPVCDIDCKNSVLYAGFGGFGNRAAAFDISSNEYTDLWKGPTVQGDVQAVAGSDNGYVFFSFHQGLFDSTDFFRCAVLNAKNGNLYDILPEMNSFFGVWSIDAEKDYLVVGGTFTRLGDNKQNNLAIFSKPPYPISSPPGRVLLPDPTDSAFANPRNLSLKWLFAAFADSYEVKVAVDTLFYNGATYSGITNLTKRISGLEYCTRYFWKVRAVNQWGYGPWSEIRQFSTIPDQSDIPVIIQPIDGSDNLPVDFQSVWQPGLNALSYTLQISTEIDFSTTQVNLTNLLDTNAMITGLSNNTQYFLRIRAETIGGPTEWAEADFITIPLTLKTPTPKKPENNQTNVINLPVLSWEKITNAESYQVQLSKYPDFHNPVLNLENFTDTSIVTPELQMNTRYFWRLQAINQQGFSQWSDTWQFTTASEDPGIPEIVYPVKGVQYIPVNLLCCWHKMPDAIGYSVQLSENIDFSTKIFDINNLSDTTFYIEKLSYDSRYYLRVRANMSEGSTDWANTDFVTTTLILQAPILVAPENNQSEMTNMVAFKWEKVTEANFYRMQLSTDSTFTSMIMDTTVFTDTIYTKAGLQAATCYFWRLRAEKQSGNYSPWSALWKFTTQLRNKNTPVIVFPVDGTEHLPVAFQCIWNRSNNTRSYNVQISKDSNFNTIYANYSNSIDTAVNIEGLLRSTFYYLRIKTNEESADWAYCRFKTISDCPQPPSGKTPANKQIHVCCVPVLSWGKIANAESYRVQLSTDSIFTELILDSTGLSDTSLAVSELTEDTRYFWRVNASNDGGETWSLPMRFTTFYPVPCNPISLFPLTGSAIRTDSVDLIWNSSSPHVTGYLVELGYDSTMTTPVATIMTTDTICRFRGLADKARIYWRVKAFNYTGEGDYSSTQVFRTSIPAAYRFALHRFNFNRGSGYIDYCIAQKCELEIKLFNLKGENVWQLKDRNATPGYYSRRITSKTLTAGLYVLRIKAGSFSSKSEAILLK